MAIKGRRLTHVKENSQVIFNQHRESLLGRQSHQRENYITFCFYLAAREKEISHSDPGLTLGIPPIPIPIPTPSLKCLSFSLWSLLSLSSCRLMDSLCLLISCLCCSISSWMWVFRLSMAFCCSLRKYCSSMAFSFLAKVLPASSRMWPEKICYLCVGRP